MTEPIKNEEQKELIPKAELDTLKTTYEQSIADLKKQVEDTKAQLLDSNYLEYLDQKKAPKGQKTEGSEEVKELKKQLAEMRAAMAEVAASQELEQVMKAHPDFNDVRKDVQKILEESKTDITIEQAYFIAKAQKPPAKEEGKPKEKLEFTTEKPSGVYPVEGDSEKKFKNENEAAQAAANEVLAKYGISGGVI